MEDLKRTSRYFWTGHIKSPCQHCDKRCAECHATCNLYAEYHKVQQAEKRRIEKIKEKENVFCPIF